MELSADYLVVGAGAMGMAFTDVLITETDATVIMVDRHHQPGGHWNDAYPFVRLHQPSSFYGVNSKKLGNDSIDVTGWNKGLYELATSGEVCTYFDQVLRRQFLASDRVRFFPMCEYKGGGVFESLLSGEQYRYSGSTIVDSTYMNVTVPSMRPPSFEVVDGANCTAPNAVPKLIDKPDQFVVIGAGKTGMDTCLFLLSQGVNPNELSWVMPRDSWLLDRATIQAHNMFRESISRSFYLMFDAMSQAESITDLFDRIEICGQLLRFDENEKPTMYRCATVTKAELAQLKRIKNIIRLGRVTKIGRDRLFLDGGDIETTPNSAHIDCTADGLEQRPATPIFNNGHITLQSVRTCQQVFSAAFIGHVEAVYDDEKGKNELCTPVPHPDTDIDYLRTTLADLVNSSKWAADPDLQEWLNNSRLDPFSQQGDRTPEDVKAEEELMTLGAGAAERLQELLTAEAS